MERGRRRQHRKTADDDPDHRHDLVAPGALDQLHHRHLGEDHHGAVEDQHQAVPGRQLAGLEQDCLWQDREHPEQLDAHDDPGDHPGQFVAPVAADLSGRAGYHRLGGECRAEGDRQAQQHEGRRAEEKHRRREKRRQQDQTGHQAAQVHGDAVVGRAFLGLGRFALDQVTGNGNAVGKQRGSKHHHALIAGQRQQYQAKAGTQQRDAQGTTAKYQ
ncbi:hypothetical protein D9M69_546720 [compost metagenome]